jgi:tetratricopeptide (TPR) repeat protein
LRTRSRLPAFRSGLTEARCGAEMRGTLRLSSRSVVAPSSSRSQALSIEPSLPEAHALLGLLAAMYDYDWTAAERHFDVPMARDVGFAAFRPIYAWFQFLRGNVAQAISLAQSAIDEDPLDVWPRMNMQVYLQSAGREAEALEQLKKVLEIDEHQVVAMVAAATIHASMGDLSQALAMARRAHAVAPWYLDAVAVLAALHQRTGDAAALPLIQALEANKAFGDAPAHALFHLLCGDVGQGADWTEKAIEERDLAILVYLRFALCKDLRESHRWSKIAAMLNLQPIPAKPSN